MKTVYIIRDTRTDKESLGTMMVIDHGKVLYNSHLLELGWKDNKNDISCVPVGIYDLVLEYSDKFKTVLWEAKGIPNRSECKFHSANYYTDLNGCFAPGKRRADINYDGELDVTSSRTALREFMTAMGTDNKARLVIIDDIN